VFKSSIAKIIIIVLFLKIMSIMDFKRFVSKIYVHIFIIQNIEMRSLKNTSFVNKILCHIPLASKQCPTPSLSVSLCHKPSLFLSEIIKKYVLNKRVCSMTKNFNATLMFPTCNKYKQGKNFLNTNMSRNKVFM
jgi:hypothetical protein